RPRHLASRLVIRGFWYEDVTSETVSLLPRCSTPPPDQPRGAIHAYFYPGLRRPPGSGSGVCICARDQRVHWPVGLAVGFSRPQPDVTSRCGADGHLGGDRDRADLTGSRVLFFCRPGGDPGGHSNRWVRDCDAGRLVDTGSLTAVESAHPVAIDRIAGCVKTR